MIKIVSFSYKHNEKPGDADRIFDCRELPNPYGVPRLRYLTGEHKEVIDFLWHHPDTTTILDRAEKAAQSPAVQVIAFGCFGGKHRSVALALMLRDRLQDQGFPTIVEHMNLR